MLWLGANPFTGYLATELWDFDAGRTLAELQVQRAREAGALVQLQFAANVLAVNELLAGRLTDAAALIEEDRMVAEHHRQSARRLRRDTPRCVARQ